jgi:hypothetical protein
MKAALRGVSCLLGGNDGPAVFDSDMHLLAGQEPGVFDLLTRELDPGVKASLICSGVKSLGSEAIAEP